MSGKHASEIRAEIGFFIWTQADQDGDTVADLFFRPWFLCNNPVFFDQIGVHCDHFRDSQTFLKEDRFGICQCLIHHEGDRPYSRAFTDDHLDTPPFFHGLSRRDILLQDIALGHCRIIFLPFDLEIQPFVGQEFIRFKEGLPVEGRHFNCSAETEHFEGEIPEDEPQNNESDDIERELKHVADLSLHQLSLSGTGGCSNLTAQILPEKLFHPMILSKISLHVTE